MGRMWRNVFLLSTIWMPPLEAVVYLLCKFLGNKLFVSEDAVLLWRPVVTTPNTAGRLNQ